MERTPSHRALHDGRGAWCVVVVNDVCARRMCASKLAKSSARCRKHGHAVDSLAQFAHQVVRVLYLWKCSCKSACVLKKGAAGAGCPARCRRRCHCHCRCRCRCPARVLINVTTRQTSSHFRTRIRLRPYCLGTSSQLHLQRDCFLSVALHGHFAV